jgi:hypothetical protein
MFGRECLVQTSIFLVVLLAHFGFVSAPFSSIPMRGRLTMSNRTKAPYLFEAGERSPTLATKITIKRLLG